MFDTLVYPDVQALPPRHDDIVSGAVDSTEFPTNTILASTLRFPAISVPAGFTEDNLPVGLELLGLPFGEGPLLRVAAQVEAILRASAQAVILSRRAGTAGGTGVVPHWILIPNI